jgi:hypothetical protein
LSRGQVVGGQVEKRRVVAGQVVGGQVVGGQVVGDKLPLSQKSNLKWDAVLRVDLLTPDDLLVGLAHEVLVIPEVDKGKRK